MGQWSTPGVDRILGKNWDGWAEQTYQVFKSVLSRPRFHLTIVEGQPDEKRRLKYFYMTDTLTGDRFICKVWCQKNFSEVLIHEIQKEDSFHAVGFRFTEKFDRRKSPPMRKSALKCGVKIHHKLSFDVMNV